MKSNLTVIIVGSCMILMSCAPFSSSLPACNSQEVVSKVEQILEKSILSMTGAIKNGSIQLPAEKHYDANTDARVCHAVVETLFGSQRIGYTVEWHDKANDIFWVELIDYSIQPLQ